MNGSKKDDPDGRQGQTSQSSSSFEAKRLRPEDLDLEKMAADEFTAKLNASSAKDVPVRPGDSLATPQGSSGINGPADDDAILREIHQLQLEELRRNKDKALKEERSTTRRILLAGLVTIAIPGAAHIFSYASEKRAQEEAAERRRAKSNAFFHAFADGDSSGAVGQARDYENLDLNPIETLTWKNNEACAIMMQRSDVSENSFVRAHQTLSAALTTSLGGLQPVPIQRFFLSLGHDERVKFQVACENLLWASYHRYAPLKVGNRRIVLPSLDQEVWEFLKQCVPCNRVTGARQYSWQSDSRTAIVQCWARVNPVRVGAILPPYTVLGRMALLMNHRSEAQQYALLERMLVNEPESALAYAGSHAVWSTLFYTEGDTRMAQVFIEDLRNQQLAFSPETRLHLLPQLDGKESAMNGKSFDDQVLGGYVPCLMADINILYKPILKRSGDPMNKHFLDGYLHSLRALKSPGLNALLDGYGVG